MPFSNGKHLSIFESRNHKYSSLEDGWLSYRGIRKTAPFDAFGTNSEVSVDFLICNKVCKMFANE